FGGLTGGTFTGGTAPLGVCYRPPFNKLSRFRDPGKVNINTIFDTQIWDSVVGQFPGLRTADNFATQLFLSRQGQYGGAGLLAANANYPTWFANPFRTADSADLMPPVPPTPNPALPYSNPSMRKFFPVESTLMRPDPKYYESGTILEPLFQI